MIVVLDQGWTGGDAEDVLKRKRALFVDELVYVVGVKVPVKSLEESAAKVF